MFLTSEQKKDSLVGNLGSMIGSEWVWDLKWWINLFVWEEDQLAELLALISAVNISLASDSWVWKGDPLVSCFLNHLTNSYLHVALFMLILDHIKP